MRISDWSSDVCSSDLSGGFAIFDSAAAGNKAQERLLSGSYLSKGHDTPRKIIARYAPAGENSGASMANYTAYVARRLGIGVDDKEIGRASGRGRVCHYG